MKNKKSYKELEEKRKELFSESNKLYIAIKNLTEIREKNINKQKEIEEEIEKIQKKCKKHNWIDDGHDSHYNYYKCSKCGTEERDG